MRPTCGTSLTHFWHTFCSVPFDGHREMSAVLRRLVTRQKQNLYAAERFPSDSSRSGCKGRDTTSQKAIKNPSEDTGPENLGVFCHSTKNCCQAPVKLSVRPCPFGLPQSVVLEEMFLPKTGVLSFRSWSRIQKLSLPWYPDNFPPDCEAPNNWPGRRGERDHPKQVLLQSHLQND